MEPVIIFEDEHLMVIDKPSGMVSNRSKTSGENTVQDWHKKNLSFVDLNFEFGQKGGVVHRLDKDTSGLMVLAKSAGVYEGLKKQFVERRVHKEYVAVVEGRMKDKQGIVSQPVERIGTKFGITKNLSRMAVTNWSVINEYSISGIQYSMLKLEPLTGRTHQLRVHLKFLGHPIVGDRIYGGKGGKMGKRLLLHAKRLEFLHPLTHKNLKFEVATPDDFLVD